MSIQVIIILFMCCILQLNGQVFFGPKDVKFMSQFWVEHRIHTLHTPSATNYGMTCYMQTTYY